MPERSEVLRRVRVVAVDSPRLEWAVGREVSLPVSLLERIAGSATAATLDLRGIAPLNANGLVGDLRLRAAFTRRPSEALLPFSYQYVPATIRSGIANAMGRRYRGREQEWAIFPAWPLDLSADFVADWSAADQPVPDRRPAPVLLTHDIDSAEGLRNLVDRFLPLEEALGARSTNFVVPCAWPLDHGLLREVAQRGHEIGIHGYDHSNRTPFMDDERRRQRLRDGFAALQQYAPRGYRAPSLMRTEALITDIGEFSAYDSSIPTSGGPFPAFNNGCATARPFTIGRTLEIPISVRGDGTPRFLGYTADEIGDLWQTTAAAIAAARGVVVLLTHCEKRFSGNRPMLETYQRFLSFIHESDRFAWSTAATVAARAARA